MIDITVHNFEAEVITASMQQPVLVDFWAPWCGPCKTLVPLLEKLEAEYAGRFTLAKVDVDANQQIAAMFGIRSVPTCVLMMSGQPVDGFSGALPEGQLRSFLDKHLPPAADAPPSAADQARALAAEGGDTATAIAALTEALHAKPDDDKLRFDLVRLLIQTGRNAQDAALLGDAAALLHEPMKRIPTPTRLQALAQWLSAITFARSDDVRTAWTDAQFTQAIAAAPRDLDTRWARAQTLAAHERWTDAMGELLDILMRDKTYGEGAARKLFVAILEILTPERTPATAQTAGKSAGGIELSPKAQREQDDATVLVNSWRRKLSMALN